MKRLLTLFLVLLPVCTFAQEEEKGFTADRPGATTGTDVIGKGRVQLETEVGWELTRLDGPSSTNWTLGAAMLRWGFSDVAELRVQGARLYTKEDNDSYGGFSDVSIGTKVALFEGWKAVPAVSLLTNVIIPGGDKARYLPQHWGGQIGLLFNNQLTPWLSLGYEGDLIWSDAMSPLAFYGLCLGFDVSEKLFIGVEEFNYSSSLGTESWSELSVGFMVAPRVQIDLGTDISLNDPGQYHNIKLGLSWQITKR